MTRFAPHDVLTHDILAKGHIERVNPMTTIDVNLADDGKHYGRILTTSSNDTSALAQLETPIVSIRNGAGPRILCLGGVHGDEYIGQIFWSRLIRTLHPDRVRGHLIILPAANAAAVMAGIRRSPLDDTDLNRILPGNASGTPTQRIAHLIEHELIPQSDFLIDLHGGSTSNYYLSGPTVTETDDPKRMAQLIELLKVFGAPQGYIFGESRGGPGGTLGAARRHGIERLGSEIGSGGIVCVADLKMMQAGVTRVMAHLGVLDAELTRSLPPPHRPRILRRLSGRAGGYYYTPTSGLFEPKVDVGSEVSAGQMLGEIHTPERPNQAPTAVYSSRTGVLMTRRAPGRTLVGDCLLVVAEDYAG